jgi:hypothetical protein
VLYIEILFAHQNHRPVDLSGAVPSDTSRCRQVASIACVVLNRVQPLRLSVTP